MGAHLIGGDFQSDKYPTCPRGKVPLSVRDATAQDLLWKYAQRRRSVDAEFSDDLEVALQNAGYEPPDNRARSGPMADEHEFSVTDEMIKLTVAQFHDVDLDALGRENARRLVRDILTNVVPAILAATEAELKRAREENARMREALLYARPIVVRWCYTQGNMQQFIVDTTAPIDRALDSARDAVREG